ncbi:hypothetical protein, partial [Halanaerobacter jeridensis]
MTQTLYVLLIIILQLFFLVFCFSKKRIKKYRLLALLALVISYGLIFIRHYYLHSLGFNIEKGIWQLRTLTDALDYHNRAVYLNKHSFKFFFQELSYAFTPKYDNIWPFFISLIYKVFNSQHLIVIYFKLFFYISSMNMFAMILE